MKSICLICSKENPRFLYKIGDYSLIQCTNCKLVYTNPFPTDKELKKFYANFDFQDGFEFENVLRKDAKRTISSLLDLGAKGTLLDIGCGAGFFMDEARKMGWIPTGIDTAKIPIKYAKENLKLNVIRSDILDYRTNQKFDVISLQQVIEHIVNPFPLLSFVRQHLKPNGIFTLSTPNIESWLSVVLKKDFNYIIPPEHIVYYSPKTIALLLEKAGFKVIRSYTYGYPMDFIAIYRRLRVNKKTSKSLSQEIKKGIRSKNAKNKVGIKRSILENIVSLYGCELLNMFNKGSMCEIFATKSKNKKYI